MNSLLICCIFHIFLWNGWWFFFNSLTLTKKNSNLTSSLVTNGWFLCSLDHNPYICGQILKIMDNIVYPLMKNYDESWWFVCHCYGVHMSVPSHPYHVVHPSGGDFQQLSWVSLSTHMTFHPRYLVYSHKNTSLFPITSDSRMGDQLH